MNAEENRPCNQCGAEPGERHREWDDLARCRSTGLQLIQCEGELHEYNGRWYGIHSGPCGPSIWDGEYPGVKTCRQLGWYAWHMDEYGEDLNRLALAHARGELVWDPTSEQLVEVTK